MINQLILKTIVIDKKGFLLLLISVYYAAGFACAQDSKVEQSQKALAHSISIYDKALGRNTMVYTGRSYFDTDAGVKGHQFFGEDYWEYGKVTYNENTYDSTYLKYDIQSDLLLIENFNADGFLSPIILYSERVSSFYVMGQYFVRVEKDTISNLKEGFYNLIYSSDSIKVLAKRKKEVIKSNEINSLGEEFLQKDKYYIKLENYYHQVRKKKSILKVFADHKKEVKVFIKSRDFTFKQNPDFELVEVVKYYNTLL